MIKAQIVADSINVANGKRITSYLLTYPRFILAELNTHRMFSRNSASSRAIPLKKMIAAIEENPAHPVWWGAEQKGMQSGDEIADKAAAMNAWLDAAKDAIKHARKLADMNIHKSICNRVIEPFAHMTTLVTATEYYNFFNLRANKAAQPEFQELAYQMLDLYLDNIPVEKKIGEWHLPFADKYLSEGLNQEQMLKITTARAARTSYLTMDGEIKHEKDYELHDSLKTNHHMSPFEHAAMAIAESSYPEGNFYGWKQYRKFLENENMTTLTATRRGKK